MSDRHAGPQGLRRSLVKLAIAVVGLLILVCMKLAFVGNTLGRACEHDRDCRGVFGPVCLFTGWDHYCTHTCRANSDCAAGWGCGVTRTFDVHTHTRTESHVCIRNGAPH